jgi:hypothetical protein
VVETGVLPATTLVGGFRVPVAADAVPVPWVVQYAQAEVPTMVKAARSNRIRPAHLAGRASVNWRLMRATMALMSVALT